MKLSNFGQKFTASSPILELMDDLGSALSSDKPINMLGGGNPARIDEVDSVFIETLKTLVNTQTDTVGENLALKYMGNYSNPQGDSEFVTAIVNFMNRNYSQQWGAEISAKNVAITSGSQNAFFYLFNLFAGQFEDGSTKKILLPLAPEYIGYKDVHVDESHFVSIKPNIELCSHTLQSNQQTLDGFFKYSVDFEALKSCPDLLEGNVGAICCSRPTNPTGNVLTDVEMQTLAQIAKEYDIPFIVDNAYGMPFPSMIHTDATLMWDNQTILCCSLSKIGLPGVRTGIIIASEKVISAIESLNAIISLAPSNMGAAIATPLLNNDGIKTLSEQYIQPFYLQKSEYAIQLLQQQLKDCPIKIHKPEGAMFLWIWFEGLPISSKELYERLKAMGTIIIPSEHFFVGQKTANYTHAHECIRMSVAQSNEVLKKGIADIASLVCSLYA